MIISKSMSRTIINYLIEFKIILGLGCQIAGFLTVFASHLSIYTLTVITLERWFAITYAIHLTKRITRKCATFILMGGWIYSIIIAGLPIFRISSYSSTR